MPVFELKWGLLLIFEASMIFNLNSGFSGCMKPVLKFTQNHLFNFTLTMYAI